MCDYSKGFKLCACSGDKIKYREPEYYRKIKEELVVVPNRKNKNIPLIYIWKLYRVIDIDKTNSMIGICKMPTNNIGNGLDDEWIALNLNIENCFDFEYTPKEGDNLIITQNFSLAPFISFIYRSKEWVKDSHSFMEIIDQINEGKVKINNT